MKLKFETSAGGIVFKKQDGKTLWLTTKHSHYKKWTFPKGIVGDKKEDEGMKTAALREVEEEGGIKAKIVNSEPVKIQYAYQSKEFFIKKTVYYFLMEYIGGDPKDHDWEVEEAKFVTENEIKEMLAFKSDKEAFEKTLEKHKNHFLA